MEKKKRSKVERPIETKIEKRAKEEVGSVRIRHEKIGEGEFARTLECRENLVDLVVEFHGANGIQVEIRVFKML